MANDRALRRRLGMTPIEWLVAIAVFGILGAIAIPQVLSAREKALRQACENLFWSINAALAGECFPPVFPVGRAEDAARGTVEARSDVSNPRQRGEPAFVNEGGDATACQVVVAAESPNLIVVSQRPNAESEVRSYRIEADSCPDLPAQFE